MNHFAVQYKQDNVWKNLFVPCYLISAYQSTSYEISESEAVKKATASLVEPLNIEEVKIDKTVVDCLGNPVKNTFIVNEHLNGFSLTHIESKKNHWLSDGVDVMSIDIIEDEDPVTLHPGTLGFVEAWSDTFNDDVAQTLEAYFPELEE